MKSIGLLIFTLAAASLASLGQTNTSTNPVCYVRVDCPANSDTRVSIPVERKASFIGPVNGASGNTITVQGSPGWTVDQFKFAAGTQNETYYAVFLTGNRKGHQFTISGNSANSLTVSLGQSNLNSIASDDRVKIVPHWTLNSAFPAGQGVVASPSNVGRQTEILMTDGVSLGTNLSSVKTYIFLSVTNTWTVLGNPADVGNDVLPSHSHFIVRNKAAGTSPIFIGTLPADFQTVALRSRAGAANKQDNPVSLLRPVPVALKDSGLIESGAFLASLTQANRKDELLVYDNTTTQINKSSSRTYYYLSGAWRSLSTNFDDVGNDTIFEPGTGVIIRKAGNGGAVDSVIYWTHEDKVYTP